jgi:hypothetical protein
MLLLIVTGALFIQELDWLGWFSWFISAFAYFSHNLDADIRDMQEELEFYRIVSEEAENW